ncbi:MAG: hypothetical protein Q7T01_01620 [bacterium]|nr:hypothetical protein [bacterium]
MEDRTKRFLLLGIGIIVLIAVVLLLLRRGDAPVSVTTPSDDAAAQAQPVVGTDGLTGAGTVVVPARPSEATAVRQVARTFAERLGSFSSEGDFVNLEDLYPLMTDAYRRDRQQYVAAQRAQRSAAAAVASSAVTTVVLQIAVELPEGDDSSTARAAVGTQRTTDEFGKPPRTSTQDLDLELEKAGDRWLVSSAVWK